LRNESRQIEGGVNFERAFVQTLRFFEPQTCLRQAGFAALRMTFNLALADLKIGHYIGIGFLSARLRRRPLQNLFLLGDDLVLDLVVGGLGDDLFVDEVGFLGVRTPVNDFLGILFADARERIELLFCGAIDVDEFLFGARGGGLFGSGLRLRDSEAYAQRQNEGEEQYADCVLLHAFFSPLR
jgi:hypothetical protein